ncbi:helix-turn-helix transcriptional regulator [Rugamonas sp.]|uniref:helix-turn-helix transcriptional regulator n=1 Tax=Rugamonas sp. TaxID=1926287 RepID=UPI0025D92FEA|nr:helix-turn-helix transcriptional regulator [Rugamonas sp.]
MNEQPDTLKPDLIEQLYDAALDLQHAFPSQLYRDGDAALRRHLKRALSLRERLQRAELIAHVGDAVLTHTRSAALVVDRDLTVLHASADADALLQNGAPLRRHQGRLMADTSDGTPALAVLVARAIDADARHQQAPPLCFHRHQQAPLMVSAVPLALPMPVPRLLSGIALAIVFVREMAAAAPPALALQQLFALTPSEAVVAKALAEGGSLEQIAQSQHVTVNTVKTHMHHVYRKTATSRQGELIALILGAGVGTGAAAAPRQEQARPPHPFG